MVTSEEKELLVSLGLFAGLLLGLLAAAVGGAFPVALVIGGVIVIARDLYRVVRSEAS